MMTIHSHKSVGGVPFGASRTALSEAGSPLRESVNRLGELELDFGQIVYRFKGDRFVEATFPLPSILELNGQRVEGCSLLAFLRLHDSGFREVHGFVVAPNLGLAVDLDDGDDDNPRHWTTAFSAGRWDNIK
jgi:hypothetical protein